MLSQEEILGKVAELVALGGTQVLIQGGIHPDLKLDYYLDMVRAIHEKFPKIHIHSFSHPSPIEGGHPSLYSSPIERGLVRGI